jgi:hypothetical protein
MKMTDYERGLMLKVAGDYAPNFPILFTLKQHYPACTKILEYLYRNHFTGERLFKWIRHELNNSPLTAWKYCLSKIEMERDKRIIYGKDFV